MSTEFVLIESKPKSKDFPLRTAVLLPLSFPNPKSVYYEKGQNKEVTHSNLPHWSKEATLLFVTFRLLDSLPPDVEKNIIEEYDAWKKAQPAKLSEEELQILYRFAWHRNLNRSLDEKPYGSCLLAQPPIRSIVEEEIRRYDGQHYDLSAFVIMPNHVHLLLQPLAGYTLSSIMSSVKRISSYRIHKLLSTAGNHLWRKESFDCLVRSAQQHRRIREYIQDNPRYVSPDTYTVWLKDEPELYEGL